MSEAFRHKPQTPPTSPTKLRGPRSGSRRRDSSFSSDGEGRNTNTPARQRKKSTSQLTAGTETEPSTNGTNDILMNSSRKSTSVSADSDSGADTRQLNNNFDETVMPQKRIKRSPSEEKGVI